MKVTKEQLIKENAELRDRDGMLDAILGTGYNCRLDKRTVGSLWTQVVQSL